MLESVLTTASAPPRERSRFTAPMSTPSAVESRKDTSERSIAMRRSPLSMASVMTCLSSGAVNRSISPRAAMT